jgi:hypothetical protein
VPPQANNFDYESDEDDIPEDVMDNQTSVVAHYLAIVKEDVLKKVKKKAVYSSGNAWITPNHYSLSDVKFSPEAFYKPKVFVWIPKLLGCEIKCPKGCPSVMHVKDTRFRRIYDLSECYYVLYRRYECSDKDCDGFVSTTSYDFIQSLPHHIRLLFPAYTTTRAGLDLNVLHVIKLIFFDFRHCDHVL